MVHGNIILPISDIILLKCQWPLLLWCQPADIPYSSILRTPMISDFCEAENFFDPEMRFPPPKFIFSFPSIRPPLWCRFPNGVPPPLHFSQRNLFPGFFEENGGEMDLILIFSAIFDIFPAYIWPIFRQSGSWSQKCALLAAEGGGKFLGKNRIFPLFPKSVPPWRVDLPKCHFPPLFSTSHIPRPVLNMGRYGTVQ